MKSLARVLVRGEGVAAVCCAHLLRRSGVAVRIEGGGRARVPAIVLSQTALALIRDVFGRPDLLADQPRIDRRIVAWGPSTEPAAVPHAAIMTSEDDLLLALGADEAPGFDGPPDFVVQAGAPDATGQARFGSRTAIAAKVRMKAAADLSACWIEALDGGLAVRRAEPRRIKLAARRRRVARATAGREPADRRPNRTDGRALERLRRLPPHGRRPLGRGLADLRRLGGRLRSDLRRRRGPGGAGRRAGRRGDRGHRGGRRGAAPCFVTTTPCWRPPCVGT